MSQSNVFALNREARADAFRFGIMRMGSVGLQHLRGIKHGANRLVTYSARKGAILAGDLSELEFNWMPGLKGPRNLDMHGIDTANSIEGALRIEMDGAIVCSPTALHYADARAVMMTDRHCLIEKPATLESSQTRNLIQLSRERKVILGVAQVLPAIPEFGYLRDLILSGKELKRLEMRRWVPWSRVLDLKDMEGRGGFLMDLGIHDVHFLASLASVLKITGGKLERIWQHTEISQRAKFTLFARNTEIVCDVGACEEFDGAFTHGYRAIFSDGDDLEFGAQAFRMNDAAVTDCPALSPIEIFANEQQVFVDWVRGTRPDGAYLSPEMALKALEVIETLRQLGDGDEFVW